MKTKMYSEMAIEVIKGNQYKWCTCGYSKSMPTCNNAHREFSDKKSLKFIAEQTQTIYLCGCSETQTPPYCDNSNNCKKNNGY